MKLWTFPPNPAIHLTLWITLTVFRRRHWQLLLVSQSQFVGWDHGCQHNLGAFHLWNIPAPYFEIIFTLLPMLQGASRMRHWDSPPYGAMAMSQESTEIESCSCDILTWHRLLLGYLLVRTDGTTEYMLDIHSYSQPLHEIVFTSCDSYHTDEC